MTLGEKIEEKEGVVVLLDRLGTKGLWRGDAVKIIGEWKHLTDAFRDLVTKLKSPYRYKFTTFSDTVLITATTNKDQYLENLLSDVAITAGSLLIVGMMRNIFFRGGLNVGKFFDYEQIIMGSSVDELAQYYTLPEWIGISAAPSAHRILDEMDEKHVKLDAVFYKYDIPLKNSIEHGGWAVNWAPRAERVMSQSKSLGFNIIYNNLNEIIEQQLKNASDISSSFKWRNTKNYVRKTMTKI